MTSIPPSKLTFLGKMAVGIVLPTVPVWVWWKHARDQRLAKLEEVRTKIRVPNIQTVDDLWIEQCQPGDILLFDRRCETCASGPLAALACMAGKSLLCQSTNTVSQSGSQSGSYEHCGIIVPGFHDPNNKAKALDPSNLLLLEATASEGIVARPLLTRLEMSQSRSVLWLPLASPGEQRVASFTNRRIDNQNDNDENENVQSEKTQRALTYLQTQLATIRDKWLEESTKQQYQQGHATLGILGAVGYGIGIYHTSPVPVSPSAWLVVSVLQQAGVAEFINDRTGLETKVQDFLNDHRFQDTDTVPLRPGWKFLHPLAMREMTRR